MAADGAGLVKRAALGAPETQPWVEKFRPKTLNDVAAHKDIIDTSARTALLQDTNRPGRTVEAHSLMHAATAAICLVMAAQQHRVCQDL